VSTTYGSIFMAIAIIAIALATAISHQGH
jgi:hypothetical protein